MASIPPTVARTVVTAVLPSSYRRVARASIHPGLRGRRRSTSHSSRDFRVHARRRSEEIYRRFPYPTSGNHRKYAVSLRCRMRRNSVKKTPQLSPWSRIPSKIRLSHSEKLFTVVIIGKVKVKVVFAVNDSVHCYSTPSSVDNRRKSRYISALDYSSKQA